MLILVALILEIIFGIFLTISILRLANYDSLSEALSFSAIREDLNAISISKFILLYIIFAIIVFVILFIGVFMLLIPIVGAIIIVIVSIVVFFIIRRKHNKQDDVPENFDAVSKLSKLSDKSFQF